MNVAASWNKDVSISNPLFLVVLFTHGRVLKEMKNNRKQMNTDFWGSLIDKDSNLATLPFLPSFAEYLQL